MKKYHINEQKKLSKNFKKNKNLNSSNKLIEYMYEDLKNLSNHIDETTNLNIACGKGCSHCCNTRVEITEPEAIFIYSYIKDTLTKEQLDGIFSKIKEISSITSKMKNISDHIKLQIPCIFLSNDMCGIYEIRPFICREFHSVDLESCLKLYDKLDEKAGALESNDLKKMYYRIFLKYIDIYKENKLTITSEKFMISLLKVHENQSYIKDYFNNLK